MVIEILVVTPATFVGEAKITVVGRNDVGYSITTFGIQRIYEFVLLDPKVSDYYDLLGLLLECVGS